MFGSIPSKQIADALNKQYSIKLDKRKIELEQPIRALGYTKVPVKLHSKVNCYNYRPNGTRIKSFPTVKCWVFLSGYFCNRGSLVL